MEETLPIYWSTAWELDELPMPQRCRRSRSRTPAVWAGPAGRLMRALHSVARLATPVTYPTRHWLFAAGVPGR